MEPSDKIYCETLKCQMTFATCIARRKIALIKTDWDAPGYRSCLSCPVGSDYEQAPTGKVKRPYQTGTGGQEVVTWPGGAKVKLCPRCGKMKRMKACFKPNARYSSGYETYCNVCRRLIDAESASRRKAREAQNRERAIRQ